ncbi:MAG: succinate--CoA ligase subunit alpha [Brevefilum sp.]|nr:succinate--CoA ligase subunit alpha [Brevefilum sp.]MDT8380858.1 succinate--CoA ligase subunit alpha [Brevefilum sp.]MDW7754856.1 succinate--CoA ligase subunit alpha [Brevefilum sp.]
MSILVNTETRLLVQGITGHEGGFHSVQMLKYGTNIVAGVTPGKGGEWVLNGKIPVFDSVQTAAEFTGANASIIFVPARFAGDAILEAADAGIKLIVCITEGIPVKEMLQIKRAISHKDIRLIGPNSPGIISPPFTKVGIIPGNITKPGNVGVVSRSGTLTYEVVYALKQADIGTSTCVGIGGDPIVGTDFIDILSHFEGDSQTDVVVMIGEIGGLEEEKAAVYVANHMTKPVIGFIAGLAAPPNKRMGHAGAIIEGGVGTAESKINALKNAGIQVAHYPEEIPELIKKL